MQNLVVYGAGGHAKVVAASIARGGRWRVDGFVDDANPARAGEAFAGSRVIGGRAALAERRARGLGDCVIAFGNNRARLGLAEELARDGWRFPALVDPAALVADDVELGDGCFVGAGAIVQPGARIGAHAIVNTGAVVEHDCEVGDGAHLCPRACLAGHVRVGRGAWVGAGAVVRDRVRIGRGSFVGIGSLVLRDVADGWLAYGHPALPVREVAAP